MTVKTPPLRHLLVTIAAGLAIVLLTGGWGSKENKADHDADIAQLKAQGRQTVDSLGNRVEQQRLRDSTWKVTMDARTLRTLCAVSPSDRECR